MADFSEIIQEINTNLPDNNTQSITAAKLRDTLIDLTNTIDDQQDSFEGGIQDEFSTLQGQVETALDNLIVDNLTSTSTSAALSANQGRVLNEKIDSIEYPEEITLNLDDYTVNTTATISPEGLWDDETYPYNKFIFIPVNPGTKVSVKSPSSSSSQISFLTTNDVTVGESPDYATGWTGTQSIASGGTEASFEAPSDAVYLYVLYQRNNSNTGSYVNNRKPQWIKISQQLPYVKDSDIVNNFDSTDEDKVLSAALGPQIKMVVDSANTPTYLSPLGGYYLRGLNILPASAGELAYTWKYEQRIRFSSVIPIKGIKKIRVTANNHSSHIAFLKSFSIPTEEGGIALLDGQYPDYSSEYANMLVISSNAVREFTIPEDTNYIYFNIQYITDNQSFIPSEVLVLEQAEDIDRIVPSWFDNYEYDTYVEENLADWRIRSSVTKDKTYIIDHEAEYRLIGYGTTSNQGSSNYMIYTYRQNDRTNPKRRLFPYTIDRNFEMEPIDFEDDEYYVVLKYYYNAPEAGATHRGKGALMRKLKNDNWIPTNDNIYCVSKIKSPVMPYDYAVADTTFPQTDTWSAWSFYMPYGYTRNLFTNRKFPICSFFHGSSAFVSPDVQGYETFEEPNNIVGKLRSQGFVVFDINGYGISMGPDDYSRHWGNPRAIATVKKAYEVMVDRFNCRRGMCLSGISMGGAIAKSYALTYPQDVICCALQAPSELGGTCRYNNPFANATSMQSAGSCAIAWGYADVGSSHPTAADLMFDDISHARFYGYSISIAPIQIDGETSALSKIDMTAYTESTTPELMFGMNGQNTIEGNTNYKNFMQPFPVETKVWQGTNDRELPLRWNEMFVETARNAGSNVTLRVCPDCAHGLNQYPWVIDEMVNYICEKAKI